MLAPVLALAESKEPPDLFGVECDFYLRGGHKRSFEQQQKLIDSFHHFRIGRQANFGGFYFETKQPKKKPRAIEVTLSPLKNPLWKTEKWILPTEEVRFINVGFQNLAENSLVLNRILAAHLSLHPHDSLKVNFDRSRSLYEKALVNLRWHVHDAVLESYVQRKKYLSPNDLHQLTSYNHESGHNDVFALMSTQAKPMELMTYEELTRELLITIQISYYGTRDFLAPSLKGVLTASGFAADESNDRLPFEYRIPKDQLSLFRQKFYGRFDRFKTCELNRYAKFGKFEGAIQDYFLLNALVTARNRGMKTIIASVDKYTSRLFRSYGFKLYGPLPTERGDLQEELLYMQIDSVEFNDFFNRLAMGSENVKIQIE